MLALDKQVEAQAETHLYLTDYRSLYVADIGEVTDDNVREDPGELDHMPKYYHQPAGDGVQHSIDFWFKIFDIRRVVTGDTLEVINELRKLKNTAYHDRPVSLYGGMVNLPLIVWSDPPARWFSDAEPLNEGSLWAYHAAEDRSEARQMAMELRDNLFGRDFWPRLSPTTRSFLVAAEVQFRAHRDDVGFDVSGAAISYAKAVESELNTSLFRSIRSGFAGKQPHEREVQQEGRLLDLGGEVPHQTLGTLLHLLKHEDLVRESVRKSMPNDYGWMLDILVREAEPLRDFRNSGAHAESLSANQIEPVRRTVLGIGCEGLLERLVRVRLRANG